MTVKNKIMVWLCIFLASCQSSNLSKLQQQVHEKKLLDHLVSVEYQKNQALLVHDQSLMDKRQTFRIIDQHSRPVDQNIRFIEEYQYYNLNISVYQTSQGELQKNSGYFIVSIDSSGMGQAFDFLLFDSNYKFLDSYQAGSKFIESPLHYSFKNLGHQQIVMTIVYNTSSSGLYSEYLKLLAIDQGKFSEAFSWPVFQISAAHDQPVLQEVKYSFSDLNADGIADLLLHSSKKNVKLTERLKEYILIDEIENQEIVYIWDQQKRKFIRQEK